MQAFVQYIFDPFFAHPILNLLIVFYKLFLFIKLPGAFGFAIIALTIAIRLLFQPFFQKQMETAKKMQEIKPYLDNLSSKHKNDKKQLQAEQLKLYQEHGINPTSGCLVMIIQLPVFIALYNTLNLLLLNGQAEKTIDSINKALYFSAFKIDSINSWFFGLDLVKTPKQAGDWYYLLIPVITGLLQYYQFKVSMPAPAKTLGDKPEGSKDGGGDFQKAMNTQMKYIFPAMIGWFSYTLPIGLALYWNVFSIMGIIQYRKVNGKNKILNVKSQITNKS